MEAFVAEALAADRAIEETGEVYAARDVHAWLGRLARGEAAAQAVPAVVYSRNALSNLERAFEFLVRNCPEGAEAAAEAIQAAMRCWRGIR